MAEFSPQRCSLSYPKQLFSVLAASLWLVHSPFLLSSTRCFLGCLESCSWYENSRREITTFPQAKRLKTNDFKFKSELKLPYPKTTKTTTVTWLPAPSRKCFKRCKAEELLALSLVKLRLVIVSDSRMRTFLVLSHFKNPARRASANHSAEPCTLLFATLRMTAG